MATFANAVPIPFAGGVQYATAVVMPAAEADLYNGVGGDPIQVPWGQGISAAVEFTALGAVSSQTSYVVMQTDFGDGIWFDIAWCVWTGTQGTANFLLSGGIAGNAALTQLGGSRAAGAAPAANGSSLCVLGNRIRFVGKASVTGGSLSSSSSAAPGVVGEVAASIKYNILGLR